MFIDFASIKALAVDVLDAILPTDDHDDLMDLADAVGVTAPAYDAPVSRIPFQTRPTHDDPVELAAVLRGHTGDDFARWEAEVWS